MTDIATDTATMALVWMGIFVCGPLLVMGVFGLWNALDQRIRNPYERAAVCTICVLCFPVILAIWLGYSVRQLAKHGPALLRATWHADPSRPETHR